MYIYKKGFRPTSWTCRISGCYKGVRPVYRNGDYYLKLDNNLKEINPSAYDHVMWFAKSNNMTIENEEENEKTCSK